jgi:DNA polymerase III epsilon subunit-like protein
MLICNDDDDDESLQCSQSTYVNEPLFDLKKGWVMDCSEFMFQKADNWVNQLNADEMKAVHRGVQLLKPMLPIGDTPLIFLDTETTGLEHDSEIVSLTAIRISKGYEMDVLHFQSCPMKQIPTSASMIHGITNSDVLDKPPIWQFCPLMCDFFRGCDVIGFNVKYDLDRIDYALAIYVGQIGDCQPAKMKSFCINDVIDIAHVFWAKYQTQYYKQRRTLARAHVEYVGSPLDGAHSSLSDAAACISILAGMMRLYIPEVSHWHQVKWWIARKVQTPCFATITHPKNGAITLEETGNSKWEYIWPHASEPQYWMAPLIPLHKRTGWKQQFGDIPYLRREDALRYLSGKAHILESIIEREVDAHPTS